VFVQCIGMEASELMLKIQFVTLSFPRIRGLRGESSRASINYYKLRRILVHLAPEPDVDPHAIVSLSSRKLVANSALSCLRCSQSLLLECPLSIHCPG
jgi:hypothetical protein